MVSEHRQAARMKYGQNKSIVLDAVNKKHKKERERGRIIDPNNISPLTVGGRAL